MSAFIMKCAWQIYYSLFMTIVRLINNGGLFLAKWASFKGKGKIVLVISFEANMVRFMVE